MKKLILVLIAFMYSIPLAIPLVWNEALLSEVENITVLVGLVEGFSMTEHVAKTDVELKLRLAGIKVGGTVLTKLYVVIDALEHKWVQGILFYTVDMRLIETMLPAVTYPSVDLVDALVWTSFVMGYCDVSDFRKVARETIDETMNEFLNDYLAAKQDTETTSLLQDYIDQAKELTDKLIKLAEKYIDNPKKLQSESEKLTKEFNKKIDEGVGNLSEEDQEKFTEALSELREEYYDAFAELMME